MQLFAEKMESLIFRQNLEQSKTVIQGSYRFESIWTNCTEISAIRYMKYDYYLYLQLTIQLERVS